MSLTPAQEDATRRELNLNFDLSGLTTKQIAEDLETSEEYIRELLALRPRRYDDTWILKNYLLKKVREQGKEPVPFTVLKANPHHIWFLDGNYIDRGKITT